MVEFSVPETKVKVLQDKMVCKFPVSKTDDSLKLSKINAQRPASPMSLKLFQRLMKNFLMRTGCDKCFNFDVKHNGNRLKGNQCLRDKLFVKQYDSQENKWEIVRCSVKLDYITELCTFSKKTCGGENCRNAHNRVELQLWKEARSNLLLSLGDFFLDLIESKMYAEFMLQYFIVTKGYIVKLLCKQCLQEKIEDLSYATKRRHKPRCKNGHIWNNVCVSFVEEDTNGRKQYWFADTNFAPLGSEYYKENITVCINEMKFNMTDTDIAALGKYIARKSNNRKLTLYMGNNSFAEDTSLNDDDMRVNEDLFDMMNSYSGYQDDNSDENSDDDETGNNGYDRENYYETIPAKEALENREKNPKTFKLCRIKLEGIYDTIATSIDEDMPPIQIRGRMNCGPCFEGDKVIVKLLEVAKLDSKIYVSKNPLDLKPNEPEKKSVAEVTVQHGRVIAIVKKVMRRKGSVFICTVDEYHSNLMKPVCGTVPKIHLINGALRNTLDKEDVDNNVALYTFENNKFKFKKIVKLNEKDRQDKLFVVCIIKWSKTHMYPLGYATSCLSQGTDQASSQRIIDYACHVPKRYSIDALARMNINFNNAISNMLHNREDHREEYVVTIDPPGCQDIDDALSLEQKDNHYVIGVHIADVSYFIPRGSKLDKEAFKRCRTFYPKVKEGPIHMLPAELSENYCSLLPGCDRPCISVIFSIDFNGNVLDYKIVRTLIHSKQKLTYTEVQKMLFDPNSLEINGDERLRVMLLQLNSIAQLLRKKRLGNSLHFFQFENSITADDGHDFAAHFLVEEFMILANSYVAEYLYNKFPDCTPLRLQGRPDNQEFEEWFKNYSYCSNIAAFIQRYLPLVSTKSDHNDVQSIPHVSLLKEIGELLIKSVQQNNIQRVREILGAEAFHPLHAVALNEWYDIQRSAEFICTETSKLINYNHFSLNKRYYTQFTSPIRRYMDIVVHRLVADTLTDSNKVAYSKAEMNKICERVNLSSTYAKKFEKFCNSILAATSLQSCPVYFSGILLKIDDKSLCFSFPELPELKQSQKSIKFGNLDVCAKPFHPEKCENNITIKDEKRMMFTWSRRIYDVEHFAKVGRLKSDDLRIPVRLAQSYHERKVPLKEWQHIVNALYSESDRRIIDDLKKVIPYLEKIPDCPEVTSEMNHSKIVQHHVPFTLQLKKAAIMHVQFAAESVRGILQPVITQLNLTPDYNLCIQHMNDAIKCFSDVATKKVKDQYDSVEEYQNIWQPIINMEAAYAAVQDSDPVTIRNVMVSLQEDESHSNHYYGQLNLDIMFCKERCINLLRNSKDAEVDMHDYLCLKFPLNACQYEHTMVKENMWVCHALAQHGAVDDNSSEDARVGTGQFCIDFVVHHFATKPPKELFDSPMLKCTVELLAKPLPHRYKNKIHI